MKPTEQMAKSALTSKTGIFAVLGGLLRGKGSGLSKIGSSQQVRTFERPIIRHPSRPRDLIWGRPGNFPGPAPVRPPPAVSVGVAVA